MIRTNAVTKLLTTVTLTVATAFAQSSDRLPVTDAEKIADALRAGPAFITKNATVLDWLSAPGAEYRVLPKGSNEWTCLPGIPGYPHDEPGCFDPAMSKNRNVLKTMRVAAHYHGRMIGLKRGWNSQSLPVRVDFHRWLDE